MESFVLKVQRGFGSPGFTKLCHGVHAGSPCGSDLGSLAVGVLSLGALYEGFS